MTLVALAMDVLAKFRGRRVGDFRLYARSVSGRRGLEIGGPSRIFSPRGALPVYRLLGSLDNCLFDRETVWNGRLQEGEPFRYHPGRPTGRQLFLDAVDLTGIADASYELVLASHVVEHIANPLRALAEIARVLRTAGVVIVVIPHREATFDHNRPVTALEHLVEDFQRDVREDDLAHLDEVLTLHDLAMDKDAGDFDAFRRRCLDNVSNRCLHHHVFDTELVARMLDCAGWTLLAINPVPSHHIVALARRPAPGVAPDNAALLSPDASWRRRSPFASDRKQHSSTSCHG